jgi:hypothetical protein
MTHRVCPWWLGYFLISPLRRIGQHPKSILAPYVHEGQIVLEPGPGMIAGHWKNKSAEPKIRNHARMPKWLRPE